MTSASSTAATTQVPRSVSLALALLRGAPAGRDDTAVRLAVNVMLTAALRGPR